MNTFADFTYSFICIFKLQKETKKENNSENVQTFSGEIWHDKLWEKLSVNF